MRILLDTHIFLWFISGDTQLQTDIRDAIREPNNEIYLSAVSVWEAIAKLFGRVVIVLCSRHITHHSALYTLTVNISHGPDARTHRSMGAIAPLIGCVVIKQAIALLPLLPMPRTESSTKHSLREIDSVQ